MSAAAALLVAMIAIFSAGGDHRAGVAWLSAAALVTLIAGVLFTAVVAIGAATAALGLACVIAEAPAAPFVALLLFIAAEAALWSADDRLRFTEIAGPRRERLLLVGAIGSASIALGATLRLLAHDAEGGGKVYSVVAGISITLLAALLAVGVRHLPSRSQ